jgi:glycosyltransferase involved in cell wall biosynthesis
MKHLEKKRVLIFIVAYNAEKTIQSVLNRIPVELANTYASDILVIDDSSKDATYEKAVFEKQSGGIPFNITVLFNPENQGYGGNQKLGYHYAIENGYDYVAMIHGDGQYAPELLPEMLSKFTEGVGAVFGSRMLIKENALKGGMPRYKFYGNQILTWMQNRILGSDLSEFHSGYRIYSVDALKKIPFSLNNNDFHFDTEIIIQLLFRKLPIVEVPIPTHYGDETCHVNGFKYAWDIMVQSCIAFLQRFQIFYDPKYDCLENESGVEKAKSQRLSLNTPEKTLLEAIDPGQEVTVVGSNGSSLAKALELGGCAVRYLKSNDDFTVALQNPAAASLDYFILADGIEVYGENIPLLRRLYSHLQSAPRVKLIVFSSNVAFVSVRLMLLFGLFNYSKRGILHREVRRLYTKGTLKGVLRKGGFQVSDIRGYPVPLELAIQSKWISGLPVLINRFLIKLSKSLFAYQFMLVSKPLKSLELLLGDAYSASNERLRQPEIPER